MNNPDNNEIIQLVSSSDATTEPNANLYCQPVSNPEKKPHQTNEPVYGACACCKPDDFFSFLDKKHMIGVDTINSSYGRGSYMHIQGTPPSPRVIISPWTNPLPTQSKKSNGISEE